MASQDKATDTKPARERDRDRHDTAMARAAGAIPWLTKVHADEGQMQAFVERESSALPHTELWRWAYVSGVLAEDYSCFDSELITVVEGAVSNIWRMRGTCPLHGRVHASNTWVLINTPGFVHTTLFRCHHDGSRRLLAYLPLTG